MKNYKQKGAATVEFAVILPLMLLLVVWVSEYGIMFYKQNALTKSVQTAARYLSEQLPHTTSIPANLEVNVNGVAATSVTVTSLNVDADADHVQVSATFDADLVLLGVLNNFMHMVTGGSAPINMTLSASSVMRYAK
jgi:Flp pilus assembly protein TadG